MNKLKNLKIGIFLILIGIICLIDISAQTHFDRADTNPQAEQYFSEAATSVGLHTGQLSVNIPLFNLEANGVQIPVNLAFSGTGITYSTRDNGLGLGWSLLAGGVITQTILKKRDVEGKIYSDQAYEGFKSRYTGIRDAIAREYQNSIYSGRSETDIIRSFLNGNHFDEQDLFSYSFLGNRGDVYVKYNSDGTTTRQLVQNNDCKIEKTIDGYYIVDVYGNEYLFNYVVDDGIVNDGEVCWHLSEINTAKGGQVTFEYKTITKRYEKFYSASNYRQYENVPIAKLTKIIYDYGYLEISDSYDFYLYNNNGELIKGYDVTGGINSITEFCEKDGEREYLKPMSFEYDYKLDPDNVWDQYIPQRAWAMQPRTWHVDWGLNGQPCLWSEYIYYNGQISGIDYNGYSVSGFKVGQGVDNYYNLTKIDYPSGGYEKFYYEDHKYEYTGRYGSVGGGGNDVIGKRVWRREVNPCTSLRDGKIIEYKYCLHEDNFQPIDDGFGNEIRLRSSGTLVNFPIYATTVYKPYYSDNRPRLKGYAYESYLPQNQSVGAPVYYSEVEETITSMWSGKQNGFKIYYYPTLGLNTGTNLVVTNYREDPHSTADGLVLSFNNITFGALNYDHCDEEVRYLEANYNHVHCAYPLPRFSLNKAAVGALKKEVYLDNQRHVVKKVTNEYSYNYRRIYGVTWEEYDDGGENERILAGLSENVMYGKTLREREETKYFYNSDFSVVDSTKLESSFSFIDPGVLDNSINTLGDGEVIKTEIVYPQEIRYNTTTNLSEQALVLQLMVANNMRGVPVQKIVKKDDKVISGTYTTYKQFNGKIVPEATYELNCQQATSVADPYVDSYGKVIYDSNFKLIEEYISYDEDFFKPTTIISKGFKEAFVWGYEGAYPVAKLKNATYSEVKNTLAGQTYSNMPILDALRQGVCPASQIPFRELLPNAMVTTYTYAPLTGITSETDVNGQTTYFDYDKFGHLTTVTDNDGNILKHYEYDLDNFWELLH